MRCLVRFYTNGIKRPADLPPGFVIPLPNSEETHAQRTTMLIEEAKTRAEQASIYLRLRLKAPSRRWLRHRFRPDRVDDLCVGPCKRDCAGHSSDQIYSM